MRRKLPFSACEELEKAVTVQMMTSQWNVLVSLSLWREKPEKKRAENLQKA